MRFCINKQNKQFCCRYLELAKILLLSEKQGLMDNISLQADEVQALSSIYEQEWKVMTLTPGYPSESPPQYELLAPWLRGDLRNTLAAHLDGIYCDNIGSSILYLWIERVREFLEELQETAPDIEESVSSAAVSPPPTIEADLSPCPEIIHGECIVDRKSVFQAHCAPVVTVQQVHQVIASLKECRKIASATHNMWAYRIQGAASGAFLQDCDDDGETHAGGRMLHLLEIVGVQNWVVVVTRWYGGIQLGPDRFRHINNATRNVLQLSGAISPPDEKKKRKT
ncbi:protein IMPACT-like isoform X2 [Amphibalanus amphitrite]|uniref:protein IMPACT-like isoform X2 n=1 Tax=Amphibalanus amphitrite TaxID=1232801 RepID=UPI001C922728|nr:protein IMPACT-like isoform X2 [Amphibalanus amphitrite]